MAEKPIGQAVYERAREELQRDYFADVNLSLHSFRGCRMDRQTHAEIQRCLDHCYAKWSVLLEQPLSRLILKPYVEGSPAHDVVIHHPKNPFQPPATEETELWYPPPK